MDDPCLAPDERIERGRRQIARLLAYPKIGPLTPGAIARNLGVDEPAIAPLLAALAAEGRLRRVAGGFVDGARDERISLTPDPSPAAAGEGRRRVPPRPSQSERGRCQACAAP